VGAHTVRLLSNAGVSEYADMHYNMVSLSGSYEPADRPRVGDLVCVLAPVAVARPYMRGAYDCVRLVQPCCRVGPADGILWFTTWDGLFYSSGLGSHLTKELAAFREDVASGSVRESSDGRTGRADRLSPPATALRQGLHGLLLRTGGDPTQVLREEVSVTRFNVDERRCSPNSNES
jgi:hypothetical protein